MTSFDEEQFIIAALKEDVGSGDLTSLACVPDDKQVSAQITSKQEAIVSGIGIATKVFLQIDNSLRIKSLVADGDPLVKGTVIMELTGNARSILTAERLALNFIQRMSGVATLTRHLVKKIAHTPCRLLDTRKTTPGFRYFEKMAVVHGGGLNHRFGLFDMILIKDNHIDFCGSMEKAVKQANSFREKEKLNVKIEVECRSISDVQQAAGLSGVDRIMFDNFTPVQITEALKWVNKNTETEASGGINEGNLQTYAETGVQFISVGALTHAYKSIDISLTAKTDEL